MKEKLIVVGQGAHEAAIAADRNNKQLIFEIHAPFANYISEINNTYVDYTNDLDAVMVMYSLIEYSNNYSKTSGDLRPY